MQGRHVHRVRRLTPTPDRPESPWVDSPIRVRQHDDVLDNILQFADVAAPGARHQEVQGCVAELRQVILRGMMAHPETFEKVRRENRDVLDTIA